ncbi:MAG: YfhO family protein, partial [Lachnospiraceae bacterium]|nr:YfhO family protein [Lachnospiraceae bacterium]
GKIRTIAFSLLIMVSIVEMLYSARTAYICLNSYGGEFPPISKFKDDYNNINNVISFIKSEDDGFYRIEKDFDRAINDPAMFDYIGLSLDSSCEKDEILDWLVNFGFCKTVYFTYYNGGSTSFVDDLFGVRYYVSRFDTIEKPYIKMTYEGEYHAYENKDALPMAYIAPPGLKDDDINAGNTFEKQNRLVSYWSDTPVYTKAEPSVATLGAEDKGNGRYVRTDDTGYIVYNIPITEKMPLYFYFYAPHRQDGEVFVNGQSGDVYFTVNHWNTLCAGTYEPGDTVEIKMQILGDELEISEACFYYEDKDALAEWAEAARALNASIGEVSEITSSHLTFSVDTKDAETVIVSIPYEEAWNITCDGERITSSPAIEQLMSFEVPAGSHTIEMRYTPEGTKVGIAVSTAGIILFILSLFWYTHKEEKIQSGEE